MSGELGMDPNNGGIQQNIIKSSIEAATSFLYQLLGPAAGEVGNLIGEKIRFWRFRTAIRTVLKAKEFLQKHKISPQHVDLKTLSQILEGSSLEEDESMTERWAWLLANAANPQSKVSVYPNFPDLLRQLSPKDAVALDKTYDVIVANIKKSHSSSRADPQDIYGYGVVGKHIFSLLYISQQDFEIAIDNLQRLNLILSISKEREQIQQIDSNSVYAVTDDYETPYHLRCLIFLTHLGSYFVQACRVKDENIT